MAGVPSLHQRPNRSNALALRWHGGAVLVQWVVGAGRWLARVLGRDVRNRRASVPLEAHDARREDWWGFTAERGQLTMTVLDVARLFLHVREIPGNRGARVEAIQKWGGGSPGDAWCCWWVTMVLDLYYGGKSPVPRHGSCDIPLALCKSEGWMVEHPIPGDLYFRLADPTNAVHIGFACSPIRDGRFVQLSANTSEDGLSREGTGVFEREIPYVPGKIVFARIPEKP